jgi:hypothetical protein
MTLPQAVPNGEIEQAAEEWLRKLYESRGERWDDEKPYMRTLQVNRLVAEVRAAIEQDRPHHLLEGPQ